MIQSHSCHSLTWSRGQLELLATCPVCGTDSQNSVAYQRQDDGQKMPDIWSIHACLQCNSLYLNPRPDQYTLPQAYTDYYTHSINRETSGFLKTRLINGYLNHRFGMNRIPASVLGAVLFNIIEPFRLTLNLYGRHLEKLRPGETKSLLDIGCGNGAFLKIAGEMGWKTKGCEPDKHAVSVCKTQGLDVVHGDAFHSSLDGQNFDRITMNHVIEHVREPIALLLRALDLLKPGGTLWMALPNPTAFSLSIFRQGWKGLHPPFHLVIPSQDALVTWLYTCGFIDATLLRRGTQSRGLWKESRQIASREKIKINDCFSKTNIILADILSTFSTHWSEETVIMAHKP